MGLTVANVQRIQALGARNTIRLESGGIQHGVRSQDVAIESQQAHDFAHLRDESRASPPGGNGGQTPVALAEGFPTENTELGIAHLEFAEHFVAHGIIRFVHDNGHPAIRTQSFRPRFQCGTPFDLLNGRAMEQDAITARGVI
jgi:hypothetical protein